MLTPPTFLDESEILDMMTRCYAAPHTQLQFHPVGEDSWNYRYGDYWLSLRRDLRGHVPRAFEMSAELRRQGLDFVIAPLFDNVGSIVHRLSCGPVLVFEYRDLVPCDLPQMNDAEGAEAIAILEAIHSARALPGLPEEDFGIPFAADIEMAIEVAQGRTANDLGPLCGPLVEGLRRNRAYLESVWSENRARASECKAAEGPWVLTHGEPIATNFARSEGRIMIYDMGDLALAPPERDWAHLRRTSCARPAGREPFLRFYETRWILSEIAEYSTVLLERHTGSSDDLAMFDRLIRYLPEPIR